MDTARTIRRPEPQALRGAGLGIALVACLWTGCQAKVTPAAMGAAGASMNATIRSRAEDACEQTTGRAADNAARSVMVAQLQHAEHVVARNREALEVMRTDPRWQSPEQQAAMRQAVTDTMEIIDEYEQKTDCLSQALRTDPK